jgi:hypothetical protein
MSTPTFDESDPRGKADQDAEARFPVASGTTRWVDSASASGVYNTPWGRRELTDDEVVDLRHQGHTLTLVDGDAETSLEQEKADMAHVALTNPTPPGKRK